MNSTKVAITLKALALSLLTALIVVAPSTGAAEITPADARAIAKEACIYGFPLVDNYRVLHSYFVDRGSKEFKAPWNELHNEARVYTPDDRAIQTPNSDTPYSQLGTDLRGEPLVISVPAVENCERAMAPTFPIRKRCGMVPSSWGSKTSWVVGAILRRTESAQVLRKTADGKQVATQKGAAREKAERKAEKAVAGKGAGASAPG